jgi:TM2 domain-containing membrane protein YozV
MYKMYIIRMTATIVFCAIFAACITTGVDELFNGLVTRGWALIATAAVTLGALALLYSSVFRGREG